MAVPEDFSFQRYTSEGGTMPSDIWHDYRNEKKIEDTGKLADDIREMETLLETRGIEEKTYVSGLTASRVNPKNGKVEVLLVKGDQKEFWQNPGGKVIPPEGHRAALHRELKEELGVDVAKVNSTYISTYTPFLKGDAVKAMPIHSFSSVNNPWTEEQLKAADDVSRFEWTSNPFVDPDTGKPRILTEQTDYILRNVMGFEGPTNKNTCPDPGYYGKPGKKFEGNSELLFSGKVTNDFILKEFQTLIELKGEDLQARIENQAYLDFYRELEGEFISRVVSGEITLTNVKGEHKELLEQLLTELGPEIKSEMEREIAPEIKDLKIEIEAEKENK